MAKYITFQKDGQTFGGKDVYEVANKKSGKPLASIFWYQPWRQWTVRFDDNAVWSQDCLADVREFILSLPNAKDDGAGASPAPVHRLVGPRQEGPSP